MEPPDDYEDAEDRRLRVQGNNEVRKRRKKWREKQAKIARAKKEAAKKALLAEKASRLKAEKAHRNALEEARKVERKKAIKDNTNMTYKQLTGAVEREVLPIMFRRMKVMVSDKIGKHHLLSVISDWERGYAQGRHDAARVLSEITLADVCRDKAA